MTGSTQDPATIERLLEQQAEDVEIRILREQEGPLRVPVILTPDRNEVLQTSAVLAGCAVGFTGSVDETMSVAFASQFAQFLGVHNLARKGNVEAQRQTALVLELLFARGFDQEFETRLLDDGLPHVDVLRSFIAVALTLGSPVIENVILRTRNLEFSCSGF